MLCKPKRKIGTGIGAGVLLLVSILWVAVQAHPVEAQNSAQLREKFLKMFARSYFPGRNGQIMLVPVEGEFVTSPSPAYRFMHGSPWDYDVKIPFLLYGPSYIRKGTYSEPVGQQDVAPTLAALLRVSMPAASSGQLLRQALDLSSGPPKVILVAVLDAFRQDYFERYASVLPVLTRLRREGAWFANARVNFIPSATAPGHATVATGADPRIHGITVNHSFNYRSGREEDAYPGLSPHNLMVLTLADVWNLATDGRAVIIGQGSVGYAAGSLAGHGAGILNGRPVIMAAYNRATGAWETNPDCYRLPEYLRSKNARTLLAGERREWLGHEISNLDSVRLSALFVPFEAETLLALIENEPVGADEIADLVLVNFKAPDYVGHAYGPDSAEIRETLAELDRQFSRILEAIEKKAGAKGYVMAITADHGMPPEPAAARGRKRRFKEEVEDLLHTRFDPQGRRLVSYYDPSSNQLFLDMNRLTELGIKLSDIRDHLQAQPFVFAAYTQDEVRQASLP